MNFYHHDLLFVIVGKFMLAINSGFSKRIEVGVSIYIVGEELSARGESPRGGVPPSMVDTTTNSKIRINASSAIDGNPHLIYTSIPIHNSTLPTILIQQHTSNNLNTTTDFHQS